MSPSLLGLTSHRTRKLRTCGCAIDAYEHGCRVQDSVLKELERLIPLSRQPPQELHEKAGACSVCHMEHGVPGLVCTHCKLEKDIIKWESHLFRSAPFPLYSLLCGASGMILATVHCRSAIVHILAHSVASTSVQVICQGAQARSLCNTLAGV